MTSPNLQCSNNVRKCFKIKLAGYHIMEVWLMVYAKDMVYYILRTKTNLWVGLRKTKQMVMERFICTN